MYVCCFAKLRKTNFTTIQRINNLIANLFHIFIIPYYQWWFCVTCIVPLFMHTISGIFACAPLYFNHIWKKWRIYQWLVRIFDVGTMIYHGQFTTYHMKWKFYHYYIIFSFLSHFIFNYKQIFLFIHLFFMCMMIPLIVIFSFNAIT
jgi:hypothetical protein